MRYNAFYGGGIARSRALFRLDSLPVSMTREAANANEMAVGMMAGLPCTSSETIMPVYQRVGQQNAQSR